MNQQINFELFDSKGNFVMPEQEQIDKLDAATRGRWEAVRDAATNAKEVEAAMKHAEQRVHSLVRDIHEAQEFVRVNYRAPTAVENIKSHIASERAKYQSRSGPA